MGQNEYTKKLKCHTDVIKFNKAYNEMFQNIGRHKVRKIFLDYFFNFEVFLASFICNNIEQCI